jgi:hypothetical protein
MFVKQAARYIDTDEDDIDMEDVVNQREEEDDDDED